MPTLLEKGTFSFHETVELTPELKELLTKPSVDIILQILRKKITKTSIRDKVYFLEGRCGSGKSTLFISSLYKTFVDSFGGQIVCSEPRIVLTESNAQQICTYNKDIVMGTNIGFQNGSKKVIPTSKGFINFCTHRILSNILLTSVLTAPAEKAIEYLKQFKVIVIDEVHAYDDSLFQLLKYIKRVLLKYGNRYECPLFVFASATINIDALICYYFNRSSMAEIYADPEMCGYVRGEANFPVTEIFLTQSHVNRYKTLPLAQALAMYFSDEWLQILFNKTHVLELENETVYCRDVLIFLPTSRLILMVERALEALFRKNEIPVYGTVKGTTIRDVQKWRSQNVNKERVLIVCYGRDFSSAANILLLNSMEQDPECRTNEIKIILSTPIIETGKTIDTLSLCIDVGLEQTTSANPMMDHFLTQNDLVLTYVSKNQTIQRLGRVGRKTTGTFVHFYAEDVYESEFEETEINTYINTVDIKDELINETLCYFPGNTINVEKANDFIEHVNPFIIKNTIEKLVRDGIMNPFRQHIDTGNLVQINFPRELLFAEWLHIYKKYCLFEAVLLSILNKYDIPNDLNFNNVNLNGLPWIRDSIIIDESLLVDGYVKRVSLKEKFRKDKDKDKNEKKNNKRNGNRNDIQKSSDMNYVQMSMPEEDVFENDITEEDSSENNSFEDNINFENHSENITDENFESSIIGGAYKSPYIYIQTGKIIHPQCVDGYAKAIETLSEILHGSYRYSISYDMNRIWS